MRSTRAHQVKGTTDATLAAQLYVYVRDNARSLRKLSEPGETGSTRQREVSMARTTRLRALLGSIRALNARPSPHAAAPSVSARWWWTPPPPPAARGTAEDGAFVGGRYALRASLVLVTARCRCGEDVVCGAFRALYVTRTALATRGEARAYTYGRLANGCGGRAIGWRLG